MLAHEFGPLNERRGNLHAILADSALVPEPSDEIDEAGLKHLDAQRQAFAQTEVSALPSQIFRVGVGSLQGRAEESEAPVATVSACPVRQRTTSARRRDNERPAYAAAYFR
jgi:hypothetical protein